MGQDQLFQQSQQQAVARLVAEQLGCEVRHVGSEEIIRKTAPQRERRYFKHTLLTDANSEVAVFTKSGMLAPDLVRRREQFLSDLRLPEFRAPKFYGLLDLDNRRRGGMVAVWEYVTGRAIPWEEYTAEEYRQIASTAAAINAVTDEALRRMPKLYTGLRDVGPVSHGVQMAVADFEKRGRDVTALREQAAELARLESDALAHLQRMGNRFFTHMDLSRENLFFQSEGEPLIVTDWDSVCIAPPGCGMRLTMTLPESLEREMADIYVANMAERGFALNVRDVFFAMRSAQVLSSLGAGVRRHQALVEGAFPESSDFRQSFQEMSEFFIRRGLEHVHYLRY